MSKTYKKLATILCSSFILLTLMMCFCSVDASAAVKTKLKNGTYTVSGKGAMKKSQIPSKSKKLKIKKIVIKNGVKSIPERAFAECEYLESVTIPKTMTKIPNYAFGWCPNLGSVNFHNKLTAIGTMAFYGSYFEDECFSFPDSLVSIGDQAFAGSRALEFKLSPNTKKIGLEAFDANLAGEKVKVTLPGDFKLSGNSQELSETLVAKTVEFNTPVTDINTFNVIRARNIIVSDSDENYTSIDGVVYSKDKKTIIRVPSNRYLLTVAEGCETFPLSAVTYTNKSDNDVDDSIYGSYESSPLVCKYLSKITLPESLNKVTIDENAVKESEWSKIIPKWMERKYEVHILSKSLSDTDLDNLAKGLNTDKSRFLYN